MTHVRVESVDLDEGIPMLYRDFGTHVRLAHDPQQIDEAAALALLCLYVPRLVGDFEVQRLST
ncbi:hypothetical protein OIU91_28580 [Streptomyces sp. NBC_01456]|uniref:hypothetical protein n=1 Tax=unclassified Streptomyces TaxID=2593676 RepID=UPI002E2F98E7|nr:MULTISPECIES: hypothetical protein [unclassified Streptomyces]